MKRFKIIISVLFLILVITTIINIVYAVLGLFFDFGVYPSKDISLNVKLIFIIKTIALPIFILSVFILISNLKFLVRRGFFSPRLIHCFSKSGKLFFISGIIGFTTSILEILNLLFLYTYKGQITIGMDSRSLYIMLMILGVFFMLFSKVLSKGNQIQQENDLII